MTVLEKGKFIKNFVRVDNNGKQQTFTSNVYKVTNYFGA